MLKFHTQINKMVIEPMLKPMQIDRKIVRVRKVLNRVMQNPIRFQHITLTTRTLRTVHIIEDKENTKVTTFAHVSKLKGDIQTRIETYQNKTVVLVFTNVSDNYLKPYKKTMHT
jgi:hypothetical protein